MLGPNFNKFDTLNLLGSTAFSLEMLRFFWGRMFTESSQDTR